jgi:hypothetical protein
MMTMMSTVSTLLNLMPAARSHAAMSALDRELLKIEQRAASAECSIRPERTPSDAQHCS